MPRMLCPILVIMLILSLTACISQTTTPASQTFQPVTVTKAPTATPVLNPTSPAASTPTATVSRPPAVNIGNSSDGVIAFYSDRDGNPEIYIMNLDEGGVTRLTNDPGFDDSLAISPDGKPVLFLTARHDPDPRFPNFKYEIYGMDIDGKNLLRL